MKKNRKKIIYVCLSVFSISFTVHLLNGYNLFGLNRGWQSFIGKLEFHYMAIGAMFAWYLFKNPSQVLNSWFFKSKLGQLVPTVLLISYIMFYPRVYEFRFIETLISALLFGWVIVNVSVNPRKLFGLNFKITNYLGKISYGIYMYHSISIYIVSFFMLKFISKLNIYAFYLISIMMVFIITIIISSVSYKLIEVKVLNYGRKKMNSK